MFDNKFDQYRTEVGPEIENIRWVRLLSSSSAA